MKDITFAVVGSGFMGNVLATAASELPYVKCVGAADVDIARAQKLAASHGGKAYRDFHEMLDTEKPEVVFIATPEADHLEPVRAAAARGAQVFLEKPMATTLADADAINKTCQDARGQADDRLYLALRDLVCHDPIRRRRRQHRQVPLGLCATDGRHLRSAPAEWPGQSIDVYRRARH